jgi:hypothetical protein
MRYLLVGFQLARRLHYRWLLVLFRRRVCRFLLLAEYDLTDHLQSRQPFLRVGCAVGLGVSMKQRSASIHAQHSCQPRCEDETYLEYKVVAC